MMNTTWRLSVAMWVVLFVGAAAVAEQPPAMTLNLAAVKPLAFEKLGQPVVSMRMSNYVFPNADGSTWYAVIGFGVANRSPVPAQAYVVNLNTGKVSMKVYEKTQGLMAYLGQLTRDADGRFYMPHEGNDFGLWRFDPADGTLSWIADPQITERYTGYSLQTSPDRRKIYIGTASRNSLLIEYDPATQQYRHLGAQGPAKPAPVYVYSMAVDQDQVYMAVRKQPWYLVATDRKTGQQKVLMESDHGMQVLRLADLKCYAKVQVDKNPDKQKFYRLENGGATEIPELPLPKNYQEMQKVLQDGAMASNMSRFNSARPQVVFERARPDSEGKGELWWRMTTTEPGKPGQWQHANLTGIQTKPWELRMACALPDGRLLIAPREYEDYVLLDPRTDKFTKLGKSPLSTYRLESVNGKVYLMGYPGAYMVEYDPARPWTYFQWTPEQADAKQPKPEPNPRECQRWSVGLMPVHHIIASAVGADGWVYFGAHSERVAVGGGIGWWDPVNRKAGALRDPYFQQQDTAGLCAAQDGKSIVYSSRPVSDPRTNQPAPTDAKLFVLDTATKKITREIVPLPGLGSCGSVAARGNRVYGFGSAGKNVIYYVVDLDSGKTVSAWTMTGVERAIFGPAAPDGHIYAVFNSRYLARLKTADHSWELLGDLEECANLTFAGKDLYFVGPPNQSGIGRVRNLVP